MGITHSLTEDSLREAIILYWDKGYTVNDIKRHLFTNDKLPPRLVEEVIYRLGKAIAIFDSDFSAGGVINEFIVKERGQVIYEDN